MKLWFIFILACHPAPPSPLMTQIIDVEDFSGGRGIAAASDAAARNNRGLLFSEAGIAEREVSMLAPVDHLVVQARGDACNGPPKLEVYIDDQKVLDTLVTSSRLSDLSANISLTAGRHRFVVAAPNAGSDGKCARKLFVDTLNFTASRVVAGNFTAEDFSPPANAALTGENGPGLEFGSNGTARGETELATAQTALVVRLRGDQCLGPPVATFAVDDKELASIFVANEDWLDFTIPADISADKHRVTVSFTNDLFRGKHCDRNLYLQSIRFVHVRFAL